MIIWVVLGVVALILLWVALAFNGLVSVRNGSSGHHRGDAAQSIRIIEDTLTSNGLSARFQPPEEGLP